jgi:hypothetical protein
MSLRDTYTDKLKAQLDEWNTQIDILEIKAKQADIELGLVYQQQIQELKQKRDEAMTKFDELQEATEEAWEEVKKGGESIWEIIKTTFHEAKSKFDK